MNIHATRVQCLNSVHSRCAIGTSVHSRCAIGVISISCPVVPAYASGIWGRRVIGAGINGVGATMRGASIDRAELSLVHCQELLDADAAIAVDVEGIDYLLELAALQPEPFAR